MRQRCNGHELSGLARASSNSSYTSLKCRNTLLKDINSRLKQEPCEQHPEEERNIQRSEPSYVHDTAVDVAWDIVVSQQIVECIPEQ